MIIDDITPENEINSWIPLNLCTKILKGHSQELFDLAVKYNK